MTFESRMAYDIAESSPHSFPQPDPILVLALDHQIAQKLHACTSIDPTGENDVSRLVDLQILERGDSRPGSDRRKARRLFISRGGQAWRRRSSAPALGHGLRELRRPMCLRLSMSRGGANAFIARATTASA